MRAAMFDDLRRLMVGGDEDIGERFVVAQEDVVARPEALDEVRLEEQRLGLGARDDRFQMHRRLDHAHQPAGLAGARVVGDALPKAPRLADIEDRPVLADHAINARPVGQALHRLGDRLGAALEG